MPNADVSIVIRLLIFSVALFTVNAQAQTPRTVTVTGTGTARVAPDIAHITMAIVERSPTPADAQQAVAKVTERTLQMLDKLGIERKHIDTTGASVRPDYRWNQTSKQQELAGYIAQRDILVELQDLGKLGNLLEAAVQAGVNQMQPPKLDSSRRQDIYRESLALAAADARENAATLAQALDAKLDSVLEINAVEYSPQPPPMLRMQADSAMAESAAQSYNAGEIRFDSQVNVVFQLAE
jgi:uncharacterized protein YggE